MYMAVQLRDTLADSENYGAVRVTPDLSSSADIYVKAAIVDSKGNKTYSHRVQDITFSNPRNKKKS